MRHLTAALLAVFLCSTCVHAQEAQHKPMIGLEYVTGPSNGFKAGVAYIDPLPPRRIRPSDIDAWSEFLMLSVPQRIYFTALFENYLKVDLELRRELLTPLWDWAESLDAVSDLSHSDVGVAREQSKLIEKSQDAAATIRAQEQAVLFDPMQIILADEQMAHMHEVINRRARDAYLNVKPHLAGAGVDLAIVIELLDAIEPIIFTNKSAFEDTRQAYELTLTSARKKWYEAETERSVNGDLLRTQMAYVDDPTILRLRLDRMLRHAARAEQAISRLNDLYLPMFASVLSEDSAARLTEEYHAQAHPQVYPNPCAVQHIVDAALKIKTLTAQQRGAIGDIGEGAEIRFDAIQESMAAEVERWLVKFLETWSREAMPEHVATLDAMHADRVRVGEESIAALMGVLDETQAPLLDDVVDAYWHTIRARKPYSKGLRHYPG